MFKCKICKRISEPKETAFRIYKYREKFYPGNRRGFEPESEKIVCKNCYKENKNREDVKRC
jgi:hypothetical protein